LFSLPLGFVSFQLLVNRSASYVNRFWTFTALIEFTINFSLEVKFPQDSTQQYKFG